MMETDAVAVKDAREVFGDDAELDQFSRLVESRIIAKDAIKHYEAAVKKVDEQLVTLMTQRDCDKVLHGRHKCQIISKTNSRLDKEKLLMNGVTAMIIEKSMTVTHSSYLEVRELNDTTKAAAS